MRALLCCLIGLLMAGTVQAGSVQARLIRASNEQGQADAKLADVAGKLKSQFGYTHYRQLGAQQQALQSGGSTKFDLGEGFTLFVTPTGTQDKREELKLEWYSGKAKLVETTVKLATGNHVLIKGPDVGKSTILLAVTLR